MSSYPKLNNTNNAFGVALPHSNDLNKYTRFMTMQLRAVFLLSSEHRVPFLDAILRLMMPHTRLEADAPVLGQSRPREARHRGAARHICIQCAYCDACASGNCACFYLARTVVPGPARPAVRYALHPAPPLHILHLDRRTRSSAINTPICIH